MNMRCFTLKTPSPNSKGLACLRFDGYPGELYDRETIKSLRRDWYFFWYSSWNYSLREIPYHDLIDLFVAWDGLANEIRKSGRTDCVIVPGGCETAEPHDTLFYPIPDAPPQFDLIYIARFIRPKRCDIAIECVRYAVERKASFKAIFLESYGSDPGLREWIVRRRADLGLEDNLQITSVPLDAVNSILNRARISLFTSDEEGMCRAVLQSLLAERPILSYRNTAALIRSYYDDRYFNFYDQQNGEVAGRATLELLEKGMVRNVGARKYVLEEIGIRFREPKDWGDEILTAAEHLYARDGQQLNRKDIVPLDIARSQFWQPFDLNP